MRSAPNGTRSVELFESMVSVTVTFDGKARRCAFDDHVYPGPATEKRTVVDLTQESAPGEVAAGTSSPMSQQQSAIYAT
jgi:hypothetical protein